MPFFRVVRVRDERSKESAAEDRTATWDFACNGPALSLPLYPCDNVDFQVTTYYSNICPNGAYQGYGAPKGNFAITMALAELAEQLQIDQLEIIERNRVHEGQELKILGAIGADRPAAFAIHSNGNNE